MSAEYLSKSTKAELKATAEALVASGKGILAADEAVPAMGQRFATIGTVTRLNSFLISQNLFLHLNSYSAPHLKTTYFKVHHGFSYMETL